MANHEREELARLAQQMIDGELELITGCRRIVALHRRLCAPDDDAILAIIGVESETDDLPVGEERENWEVSALKEKDRQREEYLNAVREPLMEALESLAGSK